MMELDQLRKKIDSVDAQIINLLAQRQELARAVGQYKKKQHIAPLDVARWKNVLATVVEKGSKKGLSKSYIETVWNAIHEASLAIQK